MKKGWKAAWKYILHVAALAGTYFAVELLAYLLLAPGEWFPLVFSALWALLLAALCLCLPKMAGRIAFGITYYFYLAWALSQVGYYSVFGRMLWLQDIFYAGEGAQFFGDILGAFPALWWIGGIALLLLGGVVIWKYPKANATLGTGFAGLLLSVACVLGLCFMPEAVFLKDKGIWGTRSEYAQSSSYRANYNTMYDAKNVYNICGIYQLTLRDVWKHQIYPLTPAYRAAQEAEVGKLNEYFAQRGEKQDNEMTGLFEGKNVVFVLMESMDDWLITQEDTPTIYRMMEEGINFTDFYTPGYGTARTINSEFCSNTGIYLPTNGKYVFNYVTNSFNQSIANQATANGYTAEVFHYNTPDFYSRGVFEPAMGYRNYNCYADYETDTNKLYDDCLLFDIPQLNDLFFREGQTFNTIITRSAHLSYVYREVLSHYALKQYPEYRGKYGSEEEDCARVKAKLVDDMFARLLKELEEKGQLENTVIMAITDHYTYGYLNMEELYAHSGVDNTLLLEKTPCFVWSADCPSIEVTKTLNTADFVPTMLNLLGIDSPYNYLGQDAFDPSYEGYALFPNGSWISDGVVYSTGSGQGKVLQNIKEKELTEEYMADMRRKTSEFIHVSNLLLTSDYYK
ncbi:MAG: LTA synthase family protein [Oscillospiraceae bacterium]|nr:LTA synthase family protein [Oscillospiraceae bacterium]